MTDDALIHELTSKLYKLVPADSLGAVVTRVAAVIQAAVPKPTAALIGELTEARQQLETAQQRADEIDLNRGRNFRAQIDRATAAEQAIERVRALHWDNGGCCDHCVDPSTTTMTLNLAEWPCPTVAALGAAVNDSSTEAKWRI